MLLSNFESIDKGTISTESSMIEIFRKIPLLNVLLKDSAFRELIFLTMFWKIQSPAPKK